MYIVECLEGHAVLPSKNSELEMAAMERQTQGHMSPMIIPCDECPDCQSERELASYREYRYGVLATA